VNVLEICAFKRVHGKLSCTRLQNYTIGTASAQCLVTPLNNRRYINNFIYLSIHLSLCVRIRIPKSNIPLVVLLCCDWHSTHKLRCIFQTTVWL